MRFTAKELLIELLKIPSVNHCDDEGAVAEFLQAYFADAGIEASVQRIDATHANLIAYLPGISHEKHSVWNGHLDTVPYGDLSEWQTPPEKPVEMDGKLYARGASDMKSGLAAMAYTLAELARTGKKPAYDLTFIGTCDEEKNGLGAKALLEQGQFPDASELLIGEPTGLTIGVAQKGCMWLEFEVFGKTSHGAYPEQGVHAIDYAVRLAEKLKEFVTAQAHPVLGRASAQITQISGGIAPNMTPDRCRVMMDVRLVPGQTKASVLQYAEQICETFQRESKGDLQVKLCVKNDRLAVLTEPSDLFAQRFARCLEQKGIPVAYTGINYFTDASVFLKEKPDLKILLFGPGEAAMCHKANEYVSLEKYETAIEVLRSFALADF